MKKQRIHYLLLSIVAIIIVGGAFTPAIVGAQYYPDYYYPDYSSSYYPDYSYYYPDYSNQYYYQSYQSPSYSQYYQQEPYYYSQSPYYGPQYYYQSYSQPQQYYQPYGQAHQSYNQPYQQYGDNDYYDEDYQPLRVTCKVDTYNADANEYVTWTAKATGGTGSYKYSWMGERMPGTTNERQVRVKYREEGLKSPSITVKSGSQRITKACPIVSIED